MSPKVKEIYDAALEKLKKRPDFHKIDLHEVYVYAIAKYIQTHSPAEPAAGAHEYISNLEKVLGLD